MLLFAFIYITETDWNITRKILESCYNKYAVPRCSGNIGITTCITATLLTILHEIFQAV